MKYSSLLTRKITLDIKTLYQDRSLIEDKEYFNTTLMYKVLYHNGTPNPVQRSSENVSRFYLSTSVVLIETKLERYFYKLPWYVCPTLFLQKVLTFFIFFRFERARECKVAIDLWKWYSWKESFWEQISVNDGCIIWSSDTSWLYRCTGSFWWSEKYTYS